MNFFDTNLLIAASLPMHAHHRECHSRLASLRKTGAACAAHSLVEAYSVLTRLPMPYRLDTSDAMRIMENTLSFATPIALTPDETIDTLRMLARQNLGGGVTFDALILACARKTAAQRIYTCNGKHFRRIAPDLAPRILEP